MSAAKSDEAAPEEDVEVTFGVGIREEDLGGDAPISLIVDGKPVVRLNTVAAREVIAALAGAIESYENWRLLNTLN